MRLINEHVGSTNTQQKQLHIQKMRWQSHKNVIQYNKCHEPVRFPTLSTCLPLLFMNVVKAEAHIIPVKEWELFFEFSFLLSRGAREREIMGWELAVMTPCMRVREHRVRAASSQGKLHAKVWTSRGARVASIVTRSCFTTPSSSINFEEASRELITSKLII